MFKSIIDLSFPHFVKYLFWASDYNLGVFERIDLKEFNKFKSMSKYKKEEIRTKGGPNQRDDSLSSEEKLEVEEEEDESNQTIN